MSAPTYIRHPGIIAPVGGRMRVSAEWAAQRIALRLRREEQSVSELMERADLTPGEWNKGVAVLRQRGVPVCVTISDNRHVVWRGEEASRTCPTDPQPTPRNPVTDSSALLAASSPSTPTAVSRGST